MTEPISIFRGHMKPVTALCIANEEHFISSSEEGILKIWSLNTVREVLSEVKAHEESIQSISRLSKYNNTIITSGRDGLVKLWSLENYGLAHDHTIFTGAIHFCNSASLKNSQEDSNLICSPSSEETTISLWDVRTPSSPVMVYSPVDSGIMNTGMTMSLLFRATKDQAAQHIIGGYEAGHIVAYDTRSSRLLCSKQTHEEPILSLDSCPRSDHVISTGADDLLYQNLLSTPGEDVAVWKTNNAIELPSRGGTCIRYRCDGRILACARWDHTVRVFDWKRLKPIAILRYHRLTVSAVEFIEDGPFKGYFVSGSKDTSIVLWNSFIESLVDVNSGEPEALISGYEDEETTTSPPPVGWED